jgi:hypothetical protein
MSSISSRGLRNLPAAPEYDGGSDFDFVVNGRHFLCPSLVADFLSPKVARFRAVDPTHDTLAISTNDPDNNFASFLALGQGGDLRLLSADRDFFLSLCADLENAELFEQLTDHDLTIDNAPEKLAMRNQLHIDSPDEIESIASHFWGFPAPEDLDYCDLERSLRHPRLEIATEDSLFDLICETDRLGLLGFVRFEYLSPAAIVNLAGKIAHCNSSVWRAVCGRLVLPMASHPIVSKPLNGIIRDLTERCGGNVHDKGVLRVVLSGGSAGGQCRHVVDLENRALYVESVNRPGQWIAYDFKDMRVRSTAYEILSCPKQTGWDHPRSWVFEVSNDGAAWTEVDRQTHAEPLNFSGVVRTFPIVRTPECRFARMQGAGRNHANQNYLTIAAMETYGTLREGGQPYGLGALVQISNAK